MSDITDRIAGLKQLSFLLPGYSFLYPILFFPMAIAHLNSPLGASATLFVGLLIYAVPSRVVFSMLRLGIWGSWASSISPRSYEDAIETSLEQISGITKPNFEAYSVYFMAYLPRQIREKIEWRLGLHYFYSRLGFVALLHFVIFVMGTVYLQMYLSDPQGEAWKFFALHPILPGEAPQKLLDASRWLLALSVLLMSASFYPAQKAFHGALALEQGVIVLYRTGIRKIHWRWQP